MKAIGFALTEAVFGATMLGAYYLTHSNWCWWMVVLMASLSFKDYR